MSSFLFIRQRHGDKWLAAWCCHKGGYSTALLSLERHRRSKVHQEPMEGMCTNEWQKCVPSNYLCRWACCAKLIFMCFWVATRQCSLFFALEKLV
jgi:hypothetical protein